MGHARINNLGNPNKGNVRIKGYLLHATSVNDTAKLMLLVARRLSYHLGQMFSDLYLLGMRIISVICWQTTHK